MTEPGICVTVTGRTLDELRRARQAAEAVADIVELRLDGMENPDPVGALEGRLRPVIVTCRPAWEGGWFSGTEDERRRLLETAAARGAEYIDVEAAASFASDVIRGRSGKGVVVSRHVFGAAPPDVRAVYDSLRATGASVVKLAIEVGTLTDILPLFAIADAPSGPEAGRHVLIAMGPAGTSTRVLAARLGNCWTYAGDALAPGQMPAGRLLRDFRFRRIRPDAAIYGVVGNPIAHSLSPAMHNAGFAALGLNAVHLALQAADAADFVRLARSMGLRGASITAPFKIELMHHVDEVELVAERVGAINTLIVRDGRWIGANTDVAGFLAPLANRIRLNRVRASVLGAGGAARAVAVALADQGAAVTVCARRRGPAAAIANLVGGDVGRFPPEPGSWDVLVNTTPAGSAADPDNPIAGAPLDGEIVFDLVYAPAETRLLADAREAGCLTIGGLEMLVAQAERQFQLWTGQPPPAGLFRSSAAPENEIEPTPTAHHKPV
jgi:3-dehydroquinate dehydratase/shikimate dehydrogenase